MLYSPLEIFPVLARYGNVNFLEVRMLGIKQIKVTTKENYSMQSLYEKIKDETFSAGKPELIKHGFAYIIALLEYPTSLELTGV